MGENRPPDQGQEGVGKKCEQPSTPEGPVSSNGKRDGETDGRAHQTHVAQNRRHINDSQNGESQANETKGFSFDKIVKLRHGRPDAATAQVVVSRHDLIDSSNANGCSLKADQGLPPLVAISKSNALVERPMAPGPFVFEANWQEPGASLRPCESTLFNSLNHGFASLAT